MPKRFDFEDEPNEFMEAPCRCDCGNWFDLEDGHRSNKGNKVICRKCKEDEEALHYGDEVSFVEDCVINGRKVAEEYEEGIICSRGPSDGKVSVKLARRRYPIHHVPVSILEKRF
jgi:hypothetical protein